MPPQTPAQKFAQQLIAACDAHPNIPAAHGRKTWLREQLSLQGVDVTLQCVLNWFAGKTNPKPETRAVLARILGVREAVLIGIEPMSLGKPSNSHNVINFDVHLANGHIVEIRSLPLELEDRDHDRISKAISAYVST